MKIYYFFANFFFFLTEFSFMLLAKEGELTSLWSDNCGLVIA